MIMIILLKNSYIEQYAMQNNDFRTTHSQLDIGYFNYLDIKQLDI